MIALSRFSSDQLTDFIAFVLDDLAADKFILILGCLNNFLKTQNKTLDSITWNRIPVFLIERLKALLLTSTQYPFYYFYLEYRLFKENFPQKLTNEIRAALSALPLSLNKKQERALSFSSVKDSNTALQLLLVLPFVQWLSNQAHLPFIEIVRQLRMSSSFLQQLEKEKKSPGLTQKLIAFVGQLGFFSSHFFLLYREQGQKVIDELKALLPKLSRDELTDEEAQEIIRKHDLEYYRAILNLVSPPSSANMAKPEEVPGILHNTLAISNLQAHVPKALRGKSWNLEVRRVQKALKSGFPLNKAILQDLVSRLKETPKETPTVDPGSLRNLLQDYLNDKNEANKTKLMDTLYAFCAQEKRVVEGVKEMNFPETQEDELLYSHLSILEEWHREKHGFRQSWTDLLNPLLRSKKKISNTASVLNILSTMDEKQKDPTKRKEALLRILQSADPQEFRQLISNSGLREEFKKEVQQALNQIEQTQILSTQDAATVAAELLQDTTDFLNEQLQGFEEIEGKPMPLTLRAVKGQAFALADLTTGVCTYLDTYSLKEKRLFRLALFDDQSSQAVAYCRVFLQGDGENARLVIIEFNPTPELLTQVSALHLWESLMKQMPALLEELKIKQPLRLAFNPVIFSNRKEVNKLIEKLALQGKLRKKILDEKIKWQTSPLDYSFEEVWELCD